MALAIVDMTQSVNALNQVSSSKSDELGRGWKTLDAKNHLTTSIYDAAGRATTTMLHDGTQMKSAYDSVGRMKASWALDKNGSTTMGWKKLVYNARGEMQGVIQSSNGIPTDNGSGANDMVTSFTYDELGRKITQTDAKGQTTTFGYDNRGRTTGRRLPDGKTEAMEYDAIGQLRQKRDFRNTVTRYSYDVRGRMLSKVPDAALNEASVTYAYTGENFRSATRGATATSVALTTAYTMDADRGWLSMVSGPQGTVKYAYTVYGERREVEAAGGTTSYTYDVLGRMDEVSDQATGASEAKLLAKYRYDAVGNLDSTVTSNGALPVATSRYGYDSLNRLDAMSHRRGLQEAGALLSGYDYRVRADGKRTGYDETIANDQTAATPRVSARTVEFGYDDAGRLIKEESRDGDGVAYQLDWSLDKVGNRQLETRLKAKDAAATNWTGGSLTRVVSGYSANGTDWLNAATTTRGVSNAAGEAFVGATTATQTGYGYDSNGSQTRKTTESADASQSEGMEWSFEGALLRVEKGENNATKFTYDASGNRVQALTRDGAKMSAANYLVDENTAYAQVLEERDSSGELQARYVYGQGYGPILLQRRQKNAANVEEIRTRYLLADGHGSVRQLVTESGVVTDSYFYDAWGGGLSGGSGNTVNPYRYNGQQMDEATGGYYLRARYYQPGNGRFLGHDPLLGHNEDPFTLHRYLYAGADPVNHMDASGESFGGLSEALSTIGTQMQMAARTGFSVIRAYTRADSAVTKYKWLMIAYAVANAFYNAQTDNFGITVDIRLKDLYFEHDLPDIQIGFERREADFSQFPTKAKTVYIVRVGVKSKTHDYKLRFSFGEDGVKGISGGVNIPLIKSKDTILGSVGIDLALRAGISTQGGPKVGAAVEAKYKTSSALMPMNLGFNLRTKFFTLPFGEEEDAEGHFFA